MKVRFYKAAEREFDEAVQYYESQLPGLGDRYRQALKEALDRVKLFPEAYSPLSKRTRRCLVSKFPYGIIYKLAGKQIIVVAVAHLHPGILGITSKVNISTYQFAQPDARDRCSLFPVRTGKGAIGKGARPGYFGQFTILAALAGAVLLFGIWPAPLFEVMHPTIENLIEHISHSKL
ncbi:MAG: type II toxin-antitoxin system RelE/ParE family toxin [Gammaproteobacteria bacterium]